MSYSEVLEQLLMFVVFLMGVFSHHLALIDSVPPVSVVVALPSAAAAARPSAAAAARPSAAVAARPLPFPLGLAAAFAVFPWVGGSVRP